MADVIRLLGLEFHAILGDLPHERELPQPIEVDVEVETDTRAAAASDSLEDGLDYRAVHRAVSEVLMGEGPRLLETLCERIAEAILSLKDVDGVVVRARKPWAALPGPIDILRRHLVHRADVHGLIDQHVKLPISKRWKEGSHFRILAREGEIAIESSQLADASRVMDIGDVA